MVEGTTLPTAPITRRRVQVHKTSAPFSLRCGAFLIDYIVLIAIIATSTLVARTLGGGARTAGSSSEMLGWVLAIVICVLNFGILAGLTGWTIGKWATGLRIERVDGSGLGIGRAFLRHFIGYPLSILTLGIGFLVAAFMPRARSLEDFLANTVVVRDEILVLDNER